MHPPAAVASAAPRARIEYIAGRVRCPLAGVGMRAADASNRLVVDDPATELTISGGTITLRDDRAPAATTVIADLVWLAEGRNAAGARVPFTIHLEVTKTGRAFAIDLHTHEPQPLRRTDFVYEPLEVVAVDRDRRTVLVDRARLAAAVASVPMARRLAAALTTTRDHLAGVTQDPAVPGYRVLDRSIGIGALGRGALLVRARLISLAASNAPLIARGSLVEMLRDGAWELSLEALTSRALPELVRRDLILFGLDELAVLREVRAGRLARGHVLAFRCVPGAGEVRFNGERAALPDALEIARAYLEFHMLGGMLAAAVGG
ncbi:MAG: hypothetical protein E6J90_25975 [Deltaproteobacteria bacterium]|nr:MAG: hypothetical protein E6J90_25975 [Deltaproteobacteria bacterium]